MAEQDRNHGVGTESGKPSGSEKTPAPANIVGAWQAWLVACALQALAAVSSLVINLREPGAVMNVAGDGGVPDQFNELTAGQQESLAQAATMITFLLTLAITGGFVWLTYRMRAGRAWARLFLVAGSVYLIFGAVMILFGLSSPIVQAAPAWLQVTDGGLTIAAACAAAAGLALTTGKDANDWFFPKPDKEEQRKQT